jgi:phenylacetic acid degradation operon negative regulatory protein
VLAHAIDQQGIKPKSLIMSIFGDSIVPRGGSIWLGGIVKLAAAFGLAEQLVRTSTLRLANDEWLLRQQVGKLSFYSLTDDYAAADEAYQCQVYGAAADLRRNGWTIFRMFTEQLDRKEVYRLTKNLDRNGFGQLGTGVYIHPSIAKSAMHHIVKNSDGSEGGVTFYSGTLGPNADSLENLARLAWDLSELREGYEQFIEAFDQIPSLLEEQKPQPQMAFALRTLMVHRFRRLALKDPRLPPECLDHAWPGDAAFDLMSRSYSCLVPASEIYLDGIEGADPINRSAWKKTMASRFVSKTPAENVAVS